MKPCSVCKVVKVAGYFKKTATILNWINEKINPYFLGCETNNNGTEIIAKIQRYGIDIQGIATSANLTKTTREKGPRWINPGQ